MRWKISRHGHDPRQIDLLAIVALLIVIAAAYLYFTHSPQGPNTTAFIVPSQHGPVVKELCGNGSRPRRKPVRRA